MKKLLLLCAVILLVSCGARKRDLEKTTQKEEVSVKTETDLSAKNDIQKAVVKNNLTTETKSDTDSTFEGIVADSTMPATIEERVTDGVKTTTFTNFKDVKISSKQAQEETTVAQNEKESLNDQSQIDLTQKEQVDHIVEVNKKVVAVDRDYGYGWVFWLVLAVIVAGYGYYSFKKKTVDPFGWFS